MVKEEGRGARDFGGPLSVNERLVGAFSFDTRAVDVFSESGWRGEKGCVVSDSGALSGSESSETAAEELLCGVSICALCTLMALGRELLDGIADAEDLRSFGGSHWRTGSLRVRGSDIGFGGSGARP